MTKNKEEEFNLSERIDNMGSYVDAYIDFLHINDVKEFIKLLKEGFRNNLFETCEQEEEFIDKLVGEKLK